MWTNEVASTVLEFPDADTDKAVQAIVAKRPSMVILEREFATSALGSAFISRIRSDSDTGHTELLVGSHDSDRAPIPLPVEVIIPSPNLQRDETSPDSFRGTRRATRFVLHMGAVIRVDGDPATVVDMSRIGAQILFAQMLQPSQHVSVLVNTKRTSLRCPATVAWVHYELKGGTDGSYYRAGLEFFGADEDALDVFCCARRDHLRIEGRRAEDPTDDRPVELEAVGDDQGTGNERHARRDVAHERQGVPVAASSDDGRRPETRPNLNRREHPRRPGLSPRERPDLVGLQLCGDEAGGPAVVKSTTHRSGPLEPAGDGLPGQPFGPGDRRQTDPLNAQRDDRVERRSAMLEAVIGGAFRRRKRLAASDAPVATPFSGRGSVESVADDASGRDVSLQRTRGIETAWFLHGAWALSTRVLWYSNDGPNSSM